jgi:hypothetical protein
MKTALLLLCTLLTICTARAQQPYRFIQENRIKVLEQQDTLINAWAGGLNAAQYSNIDLNGNGRMDLAVFDRSSNRLLTYIATPASGGMRWEYRPEYTTLFPAMERWMLLKDFDGDGRMDIFTEAQVAFGGRGVKVYRNITPPGQALQFELVANGIMSTAFSGAPLLLPVPAGDLPAIADIDGDGDLDILAYEMGGSYVEYHRNMSMERYGHPNSWEFVKVTGCWGGFAEEHHICGTFRTGLSNCTETNPESVILPLRPAPVTVLSVESEEKIMHSGAALTAIDINNNGTIDLLSGSVHCSILNLLINRGTPQNASIQEVNTGFPAYSQPVNLFLFPAAYIADVDFDGKQDMMVTVSSPVNEENRIDFQKSNWFYKNVSTSNTPQFELQQQDFLQNTMIDLGENTEPALADFDGDGDLDLFVGHYGVRTGSNLFASISLYENIGTKQTPLFKLRTHDYLGLSAQQLRRLKPIFTDINGDGSLDFVFAGTSATGTRLQYILNTAAQGQAFQFNTAALQLLPLDISTEDSPAFYDLDGDGLTDVLVGRFSGRLLYYRNVGSHTNPAYQLANNELGGLGDNISRGNLKIFVRDLNGNGKPELITGDRSGHISIYQDITDHLQSGFLPITKTLMHPLADSLGEARLSHTHLAPVLADLDNDGKPDLIAGTREGGLLFLSNQSTVSSPDSEQPGPVSELSISPNPSYGEIRVYSPDTGTLTIYNVLGQALTQPYSFESGQIHFVNTTVWAQGVYLFRFVTSSGQAVTKRIVVQH